MQARLFGVEIKSRLGIEVTKVLVKSPIGENVHFYIYADFAITSVFAACKSSKSNLLILATSMGVQAGLAEINRGADFQHVDADVTAFERRQHGLQGDADIFPVEGVRQPFRVRQTFALFD